MARVQAETWSGEIIEAPDDEKLYDLLADMSVRHFLIVTLLDSPDPGQHYMQVYLEDDLSCQVEYREGGAHAHFEAQVPPPYAFFGHDKVAAIFQDYAHGGTAWRTALPWRPCTF